MKISVPIELDAILKQMPIQEKIRLVQRLEKETWASRMDQVFRQVDHRRGRRALSEKEILRICKDVRRQRNARGGS